MNEATRNTAREERRRSADRRATPQCGSQSDATVRTAGATPQYSSRACGSFARGLRPVKAVTKALAYVQARRSCFRAIFGTAHCLPEHYTMRF